MGSAWTPWVRPIMAACLWRKARSRTASMSRATSSAIRSQASRISIASAVSTTSEEVSPWCSQRPSGPTFSATLETKAIRSCWTSFSMASMRATSKRARCLMAARASFGTTPRWASTSVVAISTFSQAPKRLSSDQIRAISGRE